MKIWLDIRFVSSNIYSEFIIQLLREFVKKNKNQTFNIYINKQIEWFEWNNIILKKIWIKNFSINEQIKFYRILKNDNNELMIFFNQYKPILYKWEYKIFISSLKDIYYSYFSNYFIKYSFNYLIENNLKNAKEIICFDKNTNNELIEKFNIKQEKIKQITPFFPDIIIKNKNLDIKIWSKYQITNNFYIYSGWEWLEKNYEKLIHVFYKLKKGWKKIDLVFIWNNISKNINLRNIILELNMQNNIHFIWDIEQSIKKYFYENAMWTIFPSLYESFPFKLSEPLEYNCNIISSDIKNIKSILKNNISYFCPLSINNIYGKIKIDLKNRKTHNYKNILNNFTKEKTINKLLQIIK